MVLADINATTYRQLAWATAVPETEVLALADDVRQALRENARLLASAADKSGYSDTRSIVDRVIWDETHPRLSKLMDSSNLPSFEVGFKGRADAFPMAKLRAELAKLHRLNDRLRKFA